MLPATRLRLVAATGCVLALSACADSPTSSPTSVGPLASASATVVPTLACEVIDFDAFARGDYVTGIVAGPLNLSVSATAFSDVSGEVAGQARAFDTDFVSGAVNDGTDMQWDGEFARCDDCQGLATTLMVQRLGTASVLDQFPIAMNVDVKVAIKFKNALEYIRLAFYCRTGNFEFRYNIQVVFILEVSFKPFK